MTTHPQESNESAIWNNLSLPWKICLEEAWQAYCIGTIPIGAAVSDAEGRILSRGRNRIYDPSAPAGQVYQTELAHAELNALLALGIDQGDRRQWALYTTTEPCPLCLGAFYMSGIRTLHYASHDPWAGSVNLRGTTPYLGRKAIQVFAPADINQADVIAALFVDWDLRHNHGQISVVIERMQATNPRGIKLGEALHKSDDLRRWGDEQKPIQEVYDLLNKQLHTGYELYS